jgi:EAL domain-containing protein (putative c-di-GMP-specific phosphodiesterase class I)
LPSATAWYFDGRAPGEKIPRRCELASFPFVVGRSARADFSLADKHVSSAHAQFLERAGELWVHDLESSNGTFVNGKRLKGLCRVQAGDIVQFADYEFVINCAQPGHEMDESESTTLVTAFGAEDLGGSSNARALRDMIGQRKVRPHFQPTVSLPGEEIVGFEILGRGAHPALATSPWELFQLASKVGLELELSRVFRNEGVALGMDLPDEPLLFVNAHPGEVEDMSVIAEFEALRKRYPKASIVVEPHEASVTDSTQMDAIRDALRKLDMGLAYDDFGAGQSRLRELVEVPPDYLKFDMGLIRDLDRAAASQQKMLEGLVRIVRDLDIACLAEGIERDGELEFCRNVGFQYAQGFLLGRPAPVETWMDDDEDATELMGNWR